MVIDQLTALPRGSLAIRRGISRDGALEDGRNLNRALKRSEWVDTSSRRVAFFLKAAGNRLADVSAGSATDASAGICPGRIP